MKWAGKFVRDIVEIKDAAPDGWVEFWLSCGHGGRLLLGYPNGHLLVREKTTMYCWPCRRELLGGKHHRAKLDAAQVREIRERHTAGESQGRLAKAFGVSQGNIYLIVHNDTWKGI